MVLPSTGVCGQCGVQAGLVSSPRSNCLCRVFTELGESFLLECIHSPHSELGDLSVFDILLQCTANPDREAADKTFNCWYRLSEELYKLAHDTSDPLCKLFQPFVEKLMATLCRQCEFEDDGDPVSLGWERRVPVRRCEVCQ